MDYWIWIWLGVVVITMLLEFISVDMVAVWFSAGALVALILSPFTPYWVQIIVFIVVSTVLLLSFRKMVLKFLSSKEKVKTNVDALVGQNYKLLTPIINEQMGTIKINGVIWNAKTENDDQEITEGNMVEVIKISGNKVIVKPIENKTQNNM